METHVPPVTVIWKYEGHDRDARRQALGSLDYPDVRIIPAEAIGTMEQLKNAVPEGTEVCIVWADDDKPVGPHFVQEMVKPLAEGDSQAAIHLWSGNAVALPRQALRNAGNGKFQLSGQSFMKLALALLDGISLNRGFRSHVAFSSAERLAPISAEPVGMVS